MLLLRYTSAVLGGLSTSHLQRTPSSPCTHLQDVINLAQPWGGAREMHMILKPTPPFYRIPRPATHMAWFPNLVLVSLNPLPPANFEPYCALTPPIWPGRTACCDPYPRLLAWTHALCHACHVSAVIFVFRSHVCASLSRWARPRSQLDHSQRCSRLPTCSLSCMHGWAEAGSRGHRRHAQISLRLLCLSTSLQRCDSVYCIL